MRKVLFIQTAFFGDVILATAAIEQWAAAYPDGVIDVVVSKGKEALLTNHARIRKVLVFDKSRKYRDLARLIPHIRRQRYDAVFNIHRHGSSGLLAGLSGSPVRVGFDVHPLSWLYTHKVKHKKEGRHEVDRNFDLIAPWVSEKGHGRPVLYPSDADFDKVRRDKPYVTISPASVWFTKQWPADRWISLVRAIPAPYDVLILGGPGDQAQGEDIAMRADRPTEVCSGRFSFLQSAALMKGAKMNFANDSAPIHLASAMNAPVRAIFCSTIPAFGYGPLSDDGAIIEVREQLSCRPCGIHGHRQCPESHFRCSHIEIAAVLAGIEWSCI